MVKRAICLNGEIPANADLPSPESEERRLLAEEFERGRKAAIAELAKVGHAPQTSTGSFYTFCSSYATAIGTYQWPTSLAAEFTDDNTDY